jgi:polysaccharide export outer membrane protein
VRRPGIYELPVSASSMAASSLMTLAGGLEVRGQYRLSVLRVIPNGSSQMMSLPDKGGIIGDSEILFVQLAVDQTVSEATLSGGAALAGQYPITSGTKLSDVLRSPGALPPAPYTLFGIIARKDPQTLLRILLPFTPVAVLTGKEDQLLQSDDIIRVLSVNEVRLLTNTVRLYKQRQEVEQNSIRNPLGSPIPSNAGILSAADQTPALAADAQRRDIAELADQVDPVTKQAADAAQRAQQEQIAERQKVFLQQNPLLQFQQQRQQQQQQTAGQSRVTQSNQPIALPQAAEESETSEVLPPAPNFQTTDAASGQVASNREIRNFGDLARQLSVDQLVLVNFLIDHQVGLDGAVSGPGSYFVGPNVPLQDLVQAAGGTSNWADESGVELIATVVDAQSGRSATRRTQLPLRQGMLTNYIVQPRDELRFNQVFTDSSLGSATVQGEVRFSGTYQIMRGEHLSELLARAGGLTSTAYPYGTVFLRQSAAAAEREGYIRAAREIEEQLVVAMTRIGTDKIDATSFASLQSFVTELRNTTPVGRIAIAADPSVLATKPELDPLMEPGDVIYIPQRPSTISVLGQVMQPGSLPYRANATLDDYVATAGGYSQSSDESETFIVLPDGSARKVEHSWLNFNTASLPPGSTIVVPRDVTPLDTRQLILDVTGIMSQLAVTVASLAVLAKQ